ncbi:MAG: indole-3-glycerol phosphate synthase TrpC [Anaerolineae bacterium]|jgi:indole-3-glycerol phosphate synthase
MILDEILAYKQQELAQRTQAVPLTDLRARVAGQPAPLDFAAAVARPGVSLIAEVKCASPSKGLLCPDFEPIRLAATFAAHGATAISVLTDTRFFRGSLGHLSAIRSALQPPIPLLRKDFVFDRYQVYEARAHGADALLLIVAILPNSLLADLLALTHELGMAALVEVHNEAEMDRALALCPRVIGINNRNLHDFSVDLATFERLGPLVPERTMAVAESGVHTTANVRRLAAAGADAVLVGGALVTAPDVAAKVRELAIGGQP